jgi:hypothetical protein
MSKPDEALIWARKHKSVSPSMHSTLAHGYRVGQAASAERIKALEELVQNLMLEARARTMRGNTPIVTDIVKMTVPDRVALLKEADQ